jgi:hypothetical protein
MLIDSFHFLQGAAETDTRRTGYWALPRGPALGISLPAGSRQDYRLDLLKTDIIMIGG